MDTTFEIIAMNDLAAAEKDTPTTCLVCMDQCGDTIYNCGQRAHSACKDCMHGYLKAKLETHTVDIICFAEGCSAHLDVSTLSAVLSSEEFSLYNKYLRKSQNEQLRDCPKCGELVERSGDSTQLACQACNQEFCFYHGSFAQTMFSTLHVRCLLDPIACMH
jgi:hypothetical protein